jgi:hypothetical protein
MKKYSFVLIITLITSMLHAQIPNAGFENWTSMGLYEVPDQWGNMNTATSSTGVYTTAKGSRKTHHQGCWRCNYSGNYSQWPA